MAINISDILIPVKISSSIRTYVWEGLTLKTACALMFCKIKEEKNFSVISGRHATRKGRLLLYSVGKIQFYWRTFREFKFNLVFVSVSRVYRVLVGKPEGRRPLGRPRRRWVDNIRVDLQEVGCGYMGWIGLAQDRDRWRTLVSAVMNLRVPWNAGNFLTSCTPVSFSRRTLHHGVSK